MFRVYKPKNVIRVKAVQLIEANAQDLATLLMGRVDFSENPADSNTRLITGISVPTFNGPKSFPLYSWIIRGDDNELTAMTPDLFEKNYEVARNVGG